MRRATILLVLSGTFMVTFPLAALADPARPTNFQSEITELDPEVAGFDIQIVGGDAFLQVTAQPGTAVVVPGYEGEPYLRFEPEGEVWVNQRSPAYWLNRDRYQETAPPPEASSSAEPEWMRVATDGKWAWHDHRIHWMSPTLPPNVSPDTASELFAWSVPLLVNGQRVEVRGTLTWLPSRSPLPWTMTAILVAALVAVLTWRISGAGPLAVAAAGALTVGIAQAWVTPPDAGGTLNMWLAPAAALACAVGAWIRPKARSELLVAALVMLAVWALLRLSAAVMPILPSPLPTTLERGILAAVTGTTAGVTVSLVRARLTNRETP